MEAVIWIFMYGIIYCQQSVNVESIDVNTLWEIQGKYCAYIQPCSVTTSSILPSDDVTDDVYNFLNISVAFPSFPGFKCCSKCSCDTCDVYDTCCLDTLDTLPSVEELQSKHQMTCAEPHFRDVVDDEDKSSTGTAIKMFQKCPLGYQNRTITLACEKKNSQTSFMTELPVTDISTTYTYQNVYCAHCNGVRDENMKQWLAEIACVRGSFQPHRIDLVFEEIVNTETCNIIYRLEGYPQKLCKILIDRCNVTGLWETYDPTIEQACLAYTTMYNFKYKNVFCYMCNTRETRAPTECHDFPGTRTDVSFVALLHLEQDNDNKQHKTSNRCNSNEFYDNFEDICRELSCLFPKTLRNGACVYMLQTMGGVTYDVFLKMTPRNVSTLLEQIQTLSAIHNTIISRMGVQTDRWANSWARFSVSFYLKEATLANHVPFLPYKDGIVVYVRVESPERLPLDAEIIDRLAGFDDSVLVPEEMDSVEYFTNIKSFRFLNSSTDTVYDSSNDLTYTLFTLERPPINTKSYYLNLEITALFMCPLVSLNLPETSIGVLPHGVHINEFNKTLEHKDVLIEGDKGKDVSIRMCANTYESMMNSSRHNHENKPIAPETELSIMGVVSLVCTSLSMLFLVVTITTYLMFKELRSQPGVNNIILCVSLFVAQGVFQFGVGQAENVSATVCVAIGIAIHFAWLFVLFWMNVCCIHMVRVFHIINSLATKSVSVWLTLLYLAYAVLGGAIFVTINIIQSNYLNGGNSLGYGGEMCYISDSQMVTYLFVVPSGALILANITLYIFVVIKIHRTSTAISGRNQRAERNYFKIYTKLSTLTGGTWIFGYIYLLWPNDIVQYMFIVFNASQGVFLFLSFMFNGQNIKLWRESFRSSSTS